MFQPDGLDAAQLKMATLLFDKLVFVDMGSHNRSDWIARLADIWLSAEVSAETVDLSTRRKILELWTTNDATKPYNLTEAPEVLKDEKRMEALATVVNGVVDESEADDPDPDNWDSFKYRRFLMYDIAYWSRHYSKACFLGDPRSEEALKRLSDESAAPSEYKWWETRNADVGGLPWKDIVDLRRSPYLRRFREKYAELSMSGEADRLADHYLLALEKLADEVRPSTGGEIAVQVLGNIPLPVNPFAIAASISAVGRAMRLSSEFGWVYFVRAHRQHSRAAKR